MQIIDSHPKKAVVVPAGSGRRLKVIGHDVTFKLTREETSGAYSVFEAVTPPGAGVPPHVHQHEDELVHVLEGDFAFVLGDQTHTVSQGATVHFPRFVPHGFQNVGATSGRTLWTVIPGTSFERFFEELAALPADAPPDPATLAFIFGKYGIDLLPPA